MWTSVAHASSPYGPWERVDSVLPDSAQNPSAVVFSNGSVLATSRGGSGVHLYTAPSWRGPYTAFPVAPIVRADPLYTNETRDGLYEVDPFLWQNDFGFHILTHRQIGGADCDSAPDADGCTCRGGHLYSADLATWWRGAALWNCTLETTHGAVTLSARQRPSLASFRGACPILYSSGSTALVKRYVTWLSSFSMVQAGDCST